MNEHAYPSPSDSTFSVRLATGGALAFRYNGRPLLPINWQFIKHELRHHKI